MWWFDRRLISQPPAFPAPRSFQRQIYRNQSRVRRTIRTKAHPKESTTTRRLKDLLSGRLVDLQKVHVLVVDEVDRMLDMGFLPSISRIMAIVPKQRQTLCFSATLETSVAALVYDYMKDPVRVTLG